MKSRIFAAFGENVYSPMSLEKTTIKQNDPRVRDWNTDPSESFGGVPFQESRRGIYFTLFALIIIVWLALYGLMRLFPYVKNGSAVVRETKWTVSKKAVLFPDSASCRILTFGNSRMLAGIKPAILDQALTVGSVTYNMAIPGEDQYIDLLETLLENGKRPTHILIQTLPPPMGGWIETLKDDRILVARLFPFREFVRDAIIFGYEARSAGGLSAQYRSNAQQISKLIEDKGYYFIKSQSHFPGDQLPSDYRLPTDNSERTPAFNADVNNTGCLRLLQLAKKYHFEILLAPVAYREGEYRPAPAGYPTVPGGGAIDRIKILQPGYFVYPARYFSDPVHLNPNGAERYTRELAAAVSKSMSRSNN